MGKLRRHLSYANVMVTLLAFVVLCGGTAFAVDRLGKDSVGTRQLKKNAVTGAKVRDGSLRAKDIKDLKRFVAKPPRQNNSGPVGPPGPAGIGPAFQAYGDVNYDEISSSLYGSRVVSLPLPQGSYFAIAAVTVQSVNPTGDTVQCRLLDGTGGPGTQAVVQRSQWARSDQNVDAFTLTGAFAVGGGEGLDLQCSKSNPASGARITDASIVAVQVSGISGQAE